MQKDDLDHRAVCPLCGHPLKLNRVGRPKVYHPLCRKLESLLGWLENLLIEVDLTAEKKKEMRSRLWYLANCLNGKAQKLEERRSAG